MSFSNLCLMLNSAVRVFYSPVLQQRTALIGWSSLEAGIAAIEGVEKPFIVDSPGEDLDHDAINGLNY